MREWVRYLGCILAVLGSMAAVIFMLASGMGLILPLVMILALIVIISINRPGLAWACYFISVSATGIVFEAGPALIRVEMLAIPLLVLCVARLRKPGAAYTDARVLSVRTSLLALAYFIWASLTTILNAPLPVPSLWILLQILTGFLAFACLRVTDEDKAKMITTGSYILGLIAGLSLLSWCARTYFGLPAALAPGVAADGRLIGFSFETNIFASQCVGWVAVCSRWWPEMNRRVRLANVVLCVSIVLAGTRAAWIALVILLAVVGLETARRSLMWFWSSILTAGIALAFVPMMPGEIADKNSLAWRVGNLFSTDEGTGAYRASIYETALSDIDSFARAIFGSGINSFSQFHLLDPTGVSASYLSSIWIAVLYDTGIVGFLLFFGLIGSIILSGRSRKDRVVVAGVLLVCATATNLIWFQYPWVYLALLAGPGCVLPPVKRGITNGLVRVNSIYRENNHLMGRNVF